MGKEKKNYVIGPVPSLNRKALKEKGLDKNSKWRIHHLLDTGSGFNIPSYDKIILVYPKDKYAAIKELIAIVQSEKYIKNMLDRAMELMNSLKEQAYDILEI